MLDFPMTVAAIAPQVCLGDGVPTVRGSSIPSGKIHSIAYTAGDALE
jgi:hypothetical protein